MIKEEKYTKNGINLVKHFSDSDLMIKQVETGIEYKIAIDTIPCKYTYEETDKKISKRDHLKLVID